MTTPSMLDLHHLSSSNMVVDNDKHSNTDDIQKLMTYEIFSILENNFLFGGDDLAKLSLINNQQHGKVRILSIDDGGSTDGVLSAKTLLHLQSILRTKSGNPTAHISDFFDVVTGAGTGGVLAGLLFTRTEHGGPAPMFTADESLKFMVENGRRLTNYSRSGSFFRRTSSKVAKELKKVFGDHLTLKDAVKAVLIPCYDLRTGAPFLFSRADALEMDGCDFSMADVCGATVADRAVELKSTDGRTKIVAVGGGGGGVGMLNNPTAAAITHVLNNKQEFPVCKGVEDLLVVSLGNGVSHSSKSFLKIAAEGAADMVDEAVSMAFGESRRSNYVRIQGNGKRLEIRKKNNNNKKLLMAVVDEMLGEKNMESVLFKGKKLVESTNMEKLEMIAGELIKEEERRRLRRNNTILPNVVLKLQHYSTNSPRSSSATTLSTLSSCSI